MVDEQRSMGSAEVACELYEMPGFGIPPTMGYRLPHSVGTVAVVMRNRRPESRFSFRRNPTRSRSTTCYINAGVCRATTVRAPAENASQSSEGCASHAGEPYER